MKNFSLTTGGLVIAVAGTLLLQVGFTEACSNEIIANAPLLVGAVIAQIGRWRAGGVNLLGFKSKPSSEYIA